MAKIEDGTNSATLVSVDPTLKSMRASLRPPECSGWNSLGLTSGSISAIAAGGPLVSLRNLSSNIVLVGRIGVGFITTTAFTAAQMVDFAAYIARAFTTSDSGGTAIAASGTSNGKHRTALPGLSSVDLRIAAAAALTPGVRTLDANPIGMVAAWSAAVGTTIAPAPDNLLTFDSGRYPIALAQNEGLVISAVTAMGAAGVGRLYVNLELAEATNY